MPAAPRPKGKATRIAENILGLRKVRNNRSSQKDILSKKPTVEQINERRLNINGPE